VTFDWAEFMGVARNLANGPGERERRTSIGRAYYAAYWSVRGHLASHGAVVPRGSSTHAWVWDKLMGRRDQAVRQVGINGDRLKRQRHRADYESARVVTANDVKLALDRAQSIMDAVRGWP
jgi:uncharacterized protein (UPF0332 family)